MTIATSFPWLLQPIMKSLSTPARIVHIISARIKCWLDSNKFIGICLDSNKFIGICDLLEDSNNLLESGKVWFQDREAGIPQDLRAGAIIQRHRVQIYY